MDRKELIETLSAILNEYEEELDNLRINHTQLTKNYERLQDVFDKLEEDNQNDE